MSVVARYGVCRWRVPLALPRGPVAVPVATPTLDRTVSTLLWVTRDRWVWHTLVSTAHTHCRVSSLV